MYVYIYTHYMCIHMYMGVDRRGLNISASVHAMRTVSELTKRS